jgi:hypothetical protein
MERLPELNKVSGIPANLVEAVHMAIAAPLAYAG